MSAALKVKVNKFLTSFFLTKISSSFGISAVYEKFGHPCANDFHWSLRSSDMLPHADTMLIQF